MIPIPVMTTRSFIGYPARLFRITIAAACPPNE
jgi:hypothetical protein